MRTHFIRVAYVGALLALGCASSIAACSGDDEDSAGSGATNSTAAGPAGGTGGAGVGGAGGAGGTMTTGTYTSGVGGAPTVTAACQGHIYACGDIMDNDGDGLIDSQDPDCLGPCDDTEASYYGGIPGQAGPPCTVDCYFDQDSGSGNDDCHWNHECDPHEVAPGYPPESENGASCSYNPNANTPGTGQSCAQLYAAQSQACLDYCLPLTPNGCDCFGCCELPAGGGQYVWLGSDADGTKQGSCTMADIADPTKCEPCQPVAGCLNDCGTCELCIGKDTLPPECGGGGGGGAGGGGGGGQDCGGFQQCGLPGQDPCGAGYYCITGCCQAVPN